MKIGIIGSGEMGGCLATRLAKLGHTVSIANSRGPASLQAIAGKIGAVAATVEAAMKGQDVIIVSIPQKNIPDLDADLFANLPADVVVADTGNYYPTLRDGKIEAIEQTGIDSLWVQQQLRRPVVKVFNSILATSINDPGKLPGSADRIAMAVSGDDKKAKDVIFDLVDALGFDPCDVGRLDQSWKQQPGSPVYCRDMKLEELRKRLDQMGTTWNGKMRQMILSRRTSDEALMLRDYPTYVKRLQEAYS